MKCEDFIHGIHCQLGLWEEFQLPMLLETLLEPGRTDNNSVMIYYRTKLNAQPVLILIMLLMFHFLVGRRLPTFLPCPRPPWLQASWALAPPTQHDGHRADGYPYTLRPAAILVHSILQGIQNGHSRHAVSWPWLCRRKLSLEKLTETRLQSQNLEESFISLRSRFRRIIHRIKIVK